MKDSIKILNSIKQTVINIVPDAKIILYGSRARGSFKTDSDWDLLILLKNNQISPEIEKSITYPLYDLEIDLGEVISPMVYSESEWNNKYSITPLYRNILKEGKVL